MKRKLQTKVGKAVLRGAPNVCGAGVRTDPSRARGFRQFLLRGKKEVKGEVGAAIPDTQHLRLHSAMQS